MRSTEEQSIKRSQWKPASSMAQMHGSINGTTRKPKLGIVPNLFLISYRLFLSHLLFIPMHLLFFWIIGPPLLNSQICIHAPDSLILYLRRSLLLSHLNTCTKLFFILGGNAAPSLLRSFHRRCSQRWYFLRSSGKLCHRHRIWACQSRLAQTVPRRATSMS